MKEYRSGSRSEFEYPSHILTTPSQWVTLIGMKQEWMMKYGVQQISVVATSMIPAIMTYKLGRLMLK